MNRNEIMDLIPHRNDMLILDEVSFLDETGARGRYFVRGSEFFLNGHYPNNQIVPGTILCEMMAQLLAVYCSQKNRGLPVLVDISNASFKKMVPPKSDLSISVDVLPGSSNRIVKAHGEITLNNELCAFADFTVASLIHKW